MTQYKIRVTHGDRVDFFCINYGKNPYPFTSEDRRPILFTENKAEAKAIELREKFPDTTYEVIPHVFCNGF